MKSALPLIVLAILLVAMLLFTRRNRERSAAQQAKLRERITFGTQVMTTSGLYGTVTSLNGDDTVQLSIAPGVEVKWAIAALRDVESLPNQYRESIAPEEEKADDPPDDQR
ncbi:MAG TPA: preprotein translocase subunit YajC [Jatrophihabitantaceae bacterium]|nr:preprotein translocase subunit YajC [Jatrophihabitantaceae bacterium]